MGPLDYRPSADFYLVGRKRIADFRGALAFFVKRNGPEDSFVLVAHPKECGRREDTLAFNAFPYRRLALRVVAKAALHTPSFAVRALVHKTINYQSDF